MKHERITEEARQQAALYTLGLLTQHQAHCFELHLEECPVCRAEFGKLLLAVAQIGLAVKEEEPPRGFRERLEALIDSSRLPENIVGSPEETISKKEPGPEKKLAPPKKNEPEKSIFSASPGTPMSTAQPRSGKKAFVIHTIIYVIFAALAVFAFHTWQSIENENAWMQNRIESLNDNLADLRQQLELGLEDTERLEYFFKLFRNPFVRIARLKGPLSTPENTGVVFCDSLAGEIAVIGTFAPAPPEMVYQLWFTTPSGRTHIGMLPSDKTGNIFTAIKFNHSMSAFSGATAIVTLESENDLQIRTAPTEPWSASGRVE